MRGVEALLGLLFRRSCVGCGGPDAALCEACLAGWPALPPSCPTCAGPAADPRVPCRACAATPPPFALVIAPTRYGGEVRSAVRALKYHGRRDLAGPLARHLARAIALPPGDWCVVPVPAHAGRRRERGYDQAALLAKGVARALRLPLRPALQRSRPTTPQYGLDRAARVANVGGAFRVTRGVRGRPVLLIDDVMTTGATIGACAAVLLAAGATEVRVAVVARA